MAIYLSDVKRRGEEKITKTNIEGTYIKDDSSQILNRRYPTPREFPQQNWIISVQKLLTI